MGCLDKFSWTKEIGCQVMVENAKGGYRLRPVGQMSVASLRFIRILVGNSPPEVLSQKIDGLLNLT